MLTLKKENYKYTSSLAEDEVLFDELINARMELKQAAAAFNELTDSAAIDYATYSLLAAKSKYSYLLQLAKSKNLKV